MTASRTRAGSSTLTRLVSLFWFRLFCISPYPKTPIILPRKAAGKEKCGGKDKWEQADKPGSVVPAGVTRWDRQPFLSTPDYPEALATYPQARPSRPYGAFPRHACLFGVAPDGGCLVSPRPCGRTRLCGPLRHVAVPGRYPASCSAEPGLSSALAYSGCLADSHCNFIPKGKSNNRPGGHHAQTPVFRTAGCRKREAHRGRPAPSPRRRSSHALPL